jgi:hypothetical protein
VPLIEGVAQHREVQVGTVHAIGAGSGIKWDVRDGQQPFELTTQGTADA